MGGSSGHAAHLGISGFKSWFAGHEVHLMFVALVSINYLLCRFTHCHILWVSLLNYGFTMIPLQRQQVQPHSLPYQEPLVCEHIWLICSLVLAVDIEFLRTWVGHPPSFQSRIVLKICILSGC